MTTTNSLQYKKCYKAWSKSEKVVNKSSSGGAFYEVAKTVLSEGGVVFGVECKSRLIEFGRYTKERCRKAGTKPEILEQKTA